jgi:hypothetical protein
MRSSAAHLHASTGSPPGKHLAWLSLLAPTSPFSVDDERALPPSQLPLAPSFKSPVCQVSRCLSMIFRSALPQGLAFYTLPTVLATPAAPPMPYPRLQHDPFAWSAPFNSLRVEPGDRRRSLTAP